MNELLAKHPFDAIPFNAKAEWTQSAMKTFRNCKREFFWKYLMRLRHRRIEENLVVGSGFHNVVAEWYTSKFTMQSLADREAKRMRKQFVEGQEFLDQESYQDCLDATASFTGMMMGYAGNYKLDKKKWKVIFAEQQFSIPMTSIRGHKFLFRGMIDLLVEERETGRVILVEHKTASRITPGYVDRLPIDTQSRSYMYAARVLGYPVDHVIYNVVRKCQLRLKKDESPNMFHARIAQDYFDRPEFYFFRTELKYTEADLEAFEFEVGQVHDELMHVAEIGPENPRSWGINDAHCNKWGRPCPYLDLCIHGLNHRTAMPLVQNEEAHLELADTSI